MLKAITTAVKLGYKYSSKGFTFVSDNLKHVPSALEAYNAFALPSENREKINDFEQYKLLCETYKNIIQPTGDVLPKEWLLEDGYIVYEGVSFDGLLQKIVLLKSAIQRSNLQNGAITLSLLDQIHQTSYALKQRTNAGVAQKGNADYLIASSGWEVMCLIEMVNWIGSELTNFKSQTLEDIKQLDARLEYMDAIRGTQLKSVAGRGQLNLSLLFTILQKN